jgi:arylesterase/paraoxonase
VSPTYPGANGIALWNDELYVGDCRTGVARIFKINKEDKSLSTQATIELGGAADNINVVPISGDLVVARKSSSFSVVLVCGKTH